MRSVLTFSFITAFSLLGTAQKTIDKIAAQVGDNVILLSDIQAQKLQALQSGMELTPDLDCAMLEELMYQNLLINQAKLDSIDVSPEQIDSEMEQRLRVIENQIGSRQKMEEFYGKTVTEIKNEFRPIIGDQMMAQEMERQMTAEISVTPKEVQAFFNKIPSDSLPLINTQMSFQQIVIYPQVTEADKDDARNRLNEIRGEILKGKSFSTAARLNSEDPGSAQNGGEIKASKGMMVKPFEAAVFSLKVGEISEVFESEFGYHIVKLIQRLGDDYTCQHILIVPTFSNESIEKAAYRMDSCYQRLMSNEITWDDAVLEYSTDEMTRLNKGIITNPATGDQLWDAESLNEIDQQIYQLTQGMKKFDISQPNLYANLYERKQGVRIVRLYNLIDPHKANLNDDYSLIKRAAENDMRQVIINKWIQDKIGSTYIQINEPFRDCNFTNPWKKG